MLRLAAVIARRPALWRPGLTAARRFAPSGWWRRAPFLPLPDKRLVEFRSETMYGDINRPIDPVDLEAWLRWVGEQQ